MDTRTNRRRLCRVGTHDLRSQEFQNRNGQANQENSVSFMLACTTLGLFTLREKQNLYNENLIRNLNLEVQSNQAPSSKVDS